MLALGRRRPTDRRDVVGIWLGPGAGLAKGGELLIYAALRDGTEMLLQCRAARGGELLLGRGERGGGVALRFIRRHTTSVGQRAAT